MNPRPSLGLLAFGAFLPLTSGAQERPVVWDPPAIKVFPSHDKVVREPAALDQMIRDGGTLFMTRFNLADGAGRPAATGDSKPTVRIPRATPEFIRTSGPDANSCGGCHNQPTIGGSGDFAVNVFVGAHLKDPPSTSIAAEVTSERNTIGLFGSGAVESLAYEMTRELLSQREAAAQRARKKGLNQEIRLRAKRVDFGVVVARPDGSLDERRIEGIDPDLVVKPFGAKGVAISLREFSINALNQHHGIQAVERFGWERTGRRDFDEDGVEVEFTVGQVSALVLFQASLPAPRRSLPSDMKQRQLVSRGEALFRQVGCATCHVPALPMETTHFSEPNPYNRPGNVVPEDVAGQILLPFRAGDNDAGISQSLEGKGLVVSLYSDLKRHRICDEEEPFFCNETLRQDNVPTDQFLTAKLWDLAASAPYGHRGDCTTVSEVILHHGAEAAPARKAFKALDDVDKRALVLFLLTLGAGSSAEEIAVASPKGGAQ